MDLDEVVRNETKTKTSNSTMTFENPIEDTRENPSLNAYSSTITLVTTPIYCEKSHNHYTDHNDLE